MSFAPRRVKASGPTWQSLPLALGEVASGLINGVVYVVGEVNPSTLAYDINNGTWQSNLAARPFPGNHHAAEVIGGKLYLFGGLGANAQGKVQIYNPATNTWSLGAPIPFATGSASTALINGLVYYAGGIDLTGNTVVSAAVYNPVTNSWSGVAPMPVGRNHTASGTDGEKFYIFGGRGPGSGNGNTVAIGFTDVFIYNPATNTWASSMTPGSPIPPLPQARGGMGKAAYFRGEFYVMGGETTAQGTGQVNGNVYNRVDVYNPISQTWRLESPLLNARHGHFPLTDGQHIYVLGGGLSAGFGQSTSAERFQQ